MKKFSKVLFVLLILLSIGFEKIFSASGVLWGEKDLRQISTTWFDIIFPARSVESAKIIYDNGDRIYTEICADFKTSPQFRMTVTITPATDIFNAYFTNFSVNHVVLYDTVSDEGLAVFEEELLGTFRHELTHAVTLNLRNKFWSALDSVMGDAYNYGCYITMPSLIKEGAAVLEESQSGEGRLNDGFYLQTVRQAMIQEDFPLYTEVTGARDTYPGGTLAYAFGGPFMDWIYREYGQEKYIQFWYDGINVFGLSYETLFKRVYGISLKEAWNNFSLSIDYPKIASDPSSLDGVDFYGFGINGSAYSSLTAGKNGVAFIDKKTSAVWFAPWSDGGLGKSEKLFTLWNITSIRLSNDGKFLAVEKVDINSGNPRNRILIFDMETKKFHTVPELSLRDGCVVKVGECYYVAAVKTEGGRSLLSVWKILGDGKKISFEAVENRPLNQGAKIFSPVDAGGGKIAFILRDEKGWCICRGDLLDDGFSKFETVRFEKGVAIRNLSTNLSKSDGGFYGLNFSWASKSVLPRLGEISFDGELAFMDSDLSGGIFYPVASPDGKFFVHIGNYIEENRVVLMSNEVTGFVKNQTNLEAADIFDETESTVDFENLLTESKKYYGGLSRGMIVPFSTIPLFDMDCEQKNAIVFPGVSYISENPWDGLTLTVMGGINPGGEFFGELMGDFFGGAMALEISGGSSTSLLEYSVLSQVAFDEKGFAQSALRGEVLSGLSFGRNGSFVVDNVGTFVAGHELGKNFGGEGLSFADNLILQLGANWRTGPGFFQKGSAALVLNGDLNFKWKINDGAADFYDWNARIYPSVLTRIPNLLPINCVNGFTYNLPMTFVLKYAPSSTQVLGGYATAVIFGWEIQTGPTVVPVYFNRLVATLSYVFGVYDFEGGVTVLNAAKRLSSISDLFYQDYFRLTVALQLTPNLGAMANPSALGTIGLDLNFFPKKLSDGKLFTVSVATSLNF